MATYRSIPSVTRDARRWLVDSNGNRKSLDKIMTDDAVILVNEDGTVMDDVYPWAIPHVHDGVIYQPDPDSVEWSLIGQTTQMGGGHVMHSSEYIGGRLADGILEDAGYYVALDACWSGESENDDCRLEGWAVAYRPR